MTISEALAFVRTHGVVLESALGPVPTLATTIAGGSIAGGWWAHPQGRQIFALTRAVRDCPDILVCRIVNGKITYVHRRLWPALVRAASRFPEQRLARIRERHTAAGRHLIDEESFPEWVSGALSLEAAQIDEAAAILALGKWCTQ